MRIPRIYHPETIHQLGTIALSEDAAGHIGRVLRMKEGQEVLLFDGSGAEFPAVISEVSKKNVLVDVTERVESNIESLSTYILAKSFHVAIRWSSLSRNQ